MKAVEGLTRLFPGYLREPPREKKRLSECCEGSRGRGMKIRVRQIGHHVCNTDKWGECRGRGRKKSGRDRCGQCGDG